MTTKTRKPKTTTRLALDYDTELANLLSGNAHVLIGQRTCAADMTSNNGFVYPVRGWAACDDWDNANECGNGLHFCAVGAVGGDAQNDSGSTIIADGNDRRWQIVLAFASECVHIDEEKHKAPRLFVVDTDGTRDAMNAWLVAYGIDGHYCTITASGYRGQATASGDGGQATASGDGGQATASGDGGQATASGIRGQATASGDGGQATASGDGGQATASGIRGQATASGDGGQATASGYRGQATASGYRGQATASGDGGQATASGYRGQATASGDGGQATASGDGGQATASGIRGQATASGDGGQATAGNHGSAFVRNNSYAKTGNNGVIVTTWFDYNDAQQVKAWTVGENRDLKADTLYFIKDGVATEYVS